MNNSLYDINCGHIMNCQDISKYIQTILHGKNDFAKNI